MVKRVARLVAVVICLVAPLGWVARGDAATTATVEVTGNVVDTSMSFTINTTTFSFGDVDATGNSYNPSSSAAQPFTIGSNAYGIPQGVAWVAKQPLSFTITSPDTWILRFCATSSTNVTLSSTSSRMYMSQRLPSDEADALNAFNTSTVQNCVDNPSSGVVAGATVNQTIPLSPAYIVLPTDGPGAFSASVRFTLSVFP
jgi:type 1 fimbria pilin